MRRWMKRIGFGVALAGMTQALGCGGGVPVQLRIDEFAMDVSLDAAMDAASASLQAAGALPVETVRIPEIWPDSLPDIVYDIDIVSPKVGVDLTPPTCPEGIACSSASDCSEGICESERCVTEEYSGCKVGDAAAAFDAINKASEAIRRIELNKLVLRLESNTMTVALPRLEFQIADSKDANAADRQAWRTIGYMDGVDPGFVGDNEFSFLPGGESFLNKQLREREKEFSIRVRGKMPIDTSIDRNLPRGAAKARLIVVATFYVEPEKAVSVAAGVASDL